MEQQADLCKEADTIASAYADRYAWADIESLKVYFRLELVNDTLRALAATVHEQTMPGAKAWSVAVLRALYFSPEDRLSHAELGNRTRVPAANVTYHVDVLQQGGYVRRVPHETDRRVTLVELTEKGRLLCDELLPRRAHFISDLGRHFTEEEMRQFNEFLGRLQLTIIEPEPDPVGSSQTTSP